ncbi:hypothetical protein LB503_011670 [Fusarium chuoi]|nr:hypothetical protein LB503_011670 [Fusarium chuoi]
MKSKSIMAASAVMELALAQASADPLCSTIINLQPIEYQFQQPILIDSYFPANTDIVLDNGHVVHVTNAPTSLSTVLTDLDYAYQVSQPGVVIIQIPTSPPGVDGVPSSIPYVTVTTTGDFPSLTGSVIIEVPNTNTGSPSASYVTVTPPGDLSPTDDPSTSTFPPIPSSVAPSASSIPFVTITTTGSTLNPTDDPITSTISPSGSTGSGTVIVEVPPSSSAAGPGSSSTPASFVTRTVTGDDGNATVIIEVPPATNSPSSTPGDDSSGGPSSTGPSSPATQGPSDSAAPSSSTGDTGPSSSATEASSPSQATTDDTASSTSASAPAKTSSPANPTTSSPASSAATSPPGSSTESAASSSTSAAAANFDPCPDSLYGNPECCSLDVLGVADVECDSPTESPTDAADFQAICAASGKRARCCVLPVLGQALVCLTPVGVSN